MSEILTKVRNVDPNNSDAVKEVLSSFFQNLSKHLEGDCKRWLRALETIINRFPKYCGSHRNTIETYLTHYLDSYDYYNVIAAGKCAHALQQVRPAQDRNATPKVCWREHLLSLCNAAHKLVGLLFPTAVDMYKTSGNVQKLQLQSSATSPLCMTLDQINSVSKTKNNNVNKQLLLGTRLRNIFVFLQATLAEVYPVAKPVQPQLILEVIARALSVSSGAKEAEDISKAVSVKVQALRTLDALVACLGPNLIPFSSLIFKFSLLTLAWSSEHTNEETQKVRIGAYSTLGRWLRTLQTCRLADSPRGRRWEDELTTHVLADITPARHLVQLTMSSQPTRHLSKKAKRKLANSMLQESSIAAHSPGERNRIPVSAEASDEIAIAALDFAETFINVCGVFLKPTTHKLFQERLVRECFAYAGVRARARAPGGRVLRLLRALEALRGGAGGAPPPTQYCLQLYSVLANSRDLEVSKFCSQALLNIRLHLHCSPPSLTYAVEPEKKKGTEKPKKMSSKNRAALESLLGEEKMPKERAEEVIDLDGPSQKRPRLDNVEVADKISVSSESGSSVEVSDESDDDVQEVMAVEIDDNEDDETATQVDEVDAGQTEESQESQDTQETNEGSGTEDSRSKDASVVSKPRDESKDGRSKDAKTNGGSDPGETEDSRSQDASEVSKSKDESDDSRSKDAKTNGGSDPGQTEDSISQDASEVSKSKDESEDTSNESDTKSGSVDSSSKEEGLQQVEPNKTKESTSTSETDGETEESQEASETQDIHRATTQMPINTSDDIAEELQSPRSMEVEISYDFPNTGETRVNIIEKTEDDIPSTNETDDVQINCGQVVKSSQDVDIEKEVENKENEKPRINGDKNDEGIAKGTESVTDKLTGKDVSVEDMLADFVDEINE